MAISNFSAQEFKIVSLLNTALEKDVEVNNTFDFQDKKIKIIQPYSIKNGILSVELEYKEKNSQYLEEIEVPISKITAVAKDMNVLFLTKDNSVKTVQKNLVKKEYEEDEKTYINNQFFTGVHAVQENKSLAVQLQKAFKKAKIKIGFPYWYD